MTKDEKLGRYHLAIRAFDDTAAKLQTDLRAVLQAAAVLPVDAHPGELGEKLSALMTASTVRLWDNYAWVVAQVKGR